MSRKKTQPTPKPVDSDKPATLKELLGADTVAKLKAQAERLKEEETKRLQEKRMEEEAARQAEHKRLENDFEYLLKNDKQDWKKHK